MHSVLTTQHYEPRRWTPLKIIVENERDAKKLYKIYNNITGNISENPLPGQNQMRNWQTILLISSYRRSKR